LIEFGRVIVIVVDADGPRVFVPGGPPCHSARNHGGMMVESQEA